MSRDAPPPLPPTVRARRRRRVRPSPARAAACTTAARARPAPGPLLLPSSPSLHLLLPRSRQPYGQALPSPGDLPATTAASRHPKRVNAWLRDADELQAGCIRRDDGARFSAKETLGVFDRADRREAARALDEAARRAHLRPHRSLGELGRAESRRGRAP